MRRILILGHTGKLGTAFRQAFAGAYAVTGRNSADFDASDAAQVRKVLDQARPEIVINAVAWLGIEPSEQEPERAFRLNALYPRVLAEASQNMGFRLVHISTDAVFDGKKGGPYVESDPARPINVYGLTKYGGDCLVQAVARDYYIVRVSVLFGESPKDNQFVEKMLARVRSGQRVLRISDDIVLSPSYSRDIAGRVREMIEAPPPAGVYHVANEGVASLYDLMAEVVARLRLDVAVERASHRDFPSVGLKNLCTPLRSEKHALLRDWRAAVADYCQSIASRGRGVDHG
ncbi:MAG: NAD(P)-dependent oxidoreductase [Lentisphaerae bacterium]|nr:NAD(P)-dependent oxidoreductase [Lentisphaerota bacterium]